MLNNDLSYVKNVMMSDRDIKEYRSDINSFYEIYRAYESYKKEHDFDDMLTGCYDILTTHAEIRTYYQNRYDKNIPLEAGT